MSPATGMEIEVPERLHGTRLDAAAAQLFPEFSRSKLSGWIKSGALLVNGKRVRPRDKVTVGALLALKPEFEAEVKWAGEDRPIDIVYEDEHVIVLRLASSW